MKQYYRFSPVCRLGVASLYCLRVLKCLGMVVGLVLRVTAVASIRDAVSFDYQMFFNLLLPPIILSAGYELHQVRRELA